MAVIPVTMAATDRPWRGAQDVERPLRVAHRLPYHGIDEHRAALRLHQQRRMAEQRHPGSSYPRRQGLIAVRRRLKTARGFQKREKPGRPVSILRRQSRAEPRLDSALVMMTQQNQGAAQRE